MSNPAPPAEVTLPMSITDILGVLPHRFPFVLVDRVVAYEPKVSLEAVKQVSVNEPFFRGHFPEEPLFPGVLQIEAAAQASGILVFLSEPDNDSLLVFGQVKRFTFIQPVRPGDELRIHVTTKAMSGPQGLADVRLEVDSRPVAKGTLAYGKMPRPRQI